LKNTRIIELDGEKKLKECTTWLCRECRMELLIPTFEVDPTLYVVHKYCYHCGKKIELYVPE